MTLVVVGTPIGNLGDLSPRVVEALRNADVIACEDTRRTRKLLSHTGISAEGRLRAVHAHNEAQAAERIVDEVRSGLTVVYATDAGMPGVSDPGARIVLACRSAGLPVQVIPGPSAALAALALSGFSADQFVFEGFLPRKGRDRAERLATITRRVAHCRDLRSAEPGRRDARRSRSGRRGRSPGVRRARDHQAARRGVPRSARRRSGSRATKQSRGASTSSSLTVSRSTPRPRPMKRSTTRCATRSTRGLSGERCRRGGCHQPRSAEASCVRAGGHASEAVSFATHGSQTMWCSNSRSSVRRRGGAAEHAPLRHLLQDDPAVVVDGDVDEVALVDLEVLAQLGRQHHPTEPIDLPGHTGAHKAAFPMDLSRPTGSSVDDRRPRAAQPDFDGEHGNPSVS